MYSNQHIGRRLRIVRRKMGYTQRQIADMLGTHRETVTEIEAGRRKLQLYEFITITDKLGITLQQFFNAGNEDVT